MIAAYLVRCSDGTLYAGSTRNLDARMSQHASGLVPGYTSRRLPVELVWFQEFARVDDAWACERRLHGWSRAKKEALIAGRFDLLPGLSRKRRSV